MTNLEAILSYFNKPQGAELHLLNQGLVSTDAYSVSNEQSVEIASAHLRLSAVGAADRKEQDASINWGDDQFLISTANAIFIKYGLTDEIVSDSSVKFIQDAW
jgi:hypothetical protein